MTTSPPTPGDRLATYFDSFFLTTLAISLFGTTITFPQIPSAPPAPLHNHSTLPAPSIQSLLAASWLFFVLALGSTCVAASALALYRPQAVRAFGTESQGKERRRVLGLASGVAAGLFALVVGGFLCLALVVGAYVGAVGWVAVGFTVGFAGGGFGVLVWLWLGPVRWPGWLVGAFGGRRGREEVDGGLERQVEEREKEVAPGVSVSRVRTGLRGQGYEAEGGYGRSTSGDYVGGGGGVSRREDKFDRYSRTSTVLSDPYEPGRFGGEGMVLYDTGVREALVMSRYPD